MILAWWMYATLISAVLALAAWAIERAALRLGVATRAVWAGALCASLVWPLLAWWRAAPADPAAAATALPGSWPATWIAAVPAAYPRLPALDGWLPSIWLAASAAVLLAALVSHARLLLVARRCHPARIAGVAVWLAASEGPAVFGLWRPRILMPAWIAGSPARERRFALVHELSHIRAGDLPLLSSAFVIVCTMPWNAATWWMLHRLRQAVEVDCDRRVLSRRRGAARAYGTLLVRTATARTRAVVLASGLSSRPSLLRRRMEHLRPVSSGGGRASWVLAAVSAGLLTVVAAVPAPARPAPSTYSHSWAMPGPETQAEEPGGVYRAIEVPPGPGGVLRRREGTGGDGEATARARFSASPWRMTLREHPVSTATAAGAGDGGGSRPEGGRQR